MTWTVKIGGMFFGLFCSMVASESATHAQSPGQQSITAAAQGGRFAFVMFYRGNDAATQDMHRVLATTLAGREDAAIVPVQIGDAAEAPLIEQYDATRIPLPAVAVLAPNGAICSVLPKQVSEQQLVASIVSRGQAECLKALQDNKIVALCAQPSLDAEVPAGVRQFQSDELYRARTQVVTVLATDPSEAKFLQQLRVPAQQQTPVVAFMAPPGVMVGIFAANVSHSELAEKLAAAGKCCEDDNCKHNKAAAKQTSRR